MITLNCGVNRPPENYDRWPEIEPEPEVTTVTAYFGQRPRP